MRSLDDTSVIDKYIALKAQESEIKEQIDALKPEILSALMDEPKEKSSYAGFDFHIQRRKSWTYSEKVNELSEVLKEAKKHEEKEGIATVKKHSAVLVMKAARKEK